MIENLKIENFSLKNATHFKEAARILSVVFECYSNPTDAKEELTEICTDDGESIVLVALEENHVVGLVAANPAYGGNIWEIHPMAVRKDKQMLGIGTALMKELEKKVVMRGGMTLYVGTDDETGATSLSENDIYENTMDKINNVKNLNNHPFEFYQKCGFIIVGVVPDANGYGKPDIMMAKRVAEGNE